ncbi:MAG: hypothetical protein NTW86_12255 [Candidatus Sumerlaeota bacterium]|nr:hypothetical protein [Candidatus Sumerlaeota bacterium]
MHRLRCLAVILAFLSATRFVSPSESDPLVKELAGRSYPVDRSLVSLYNPWGERLEILNEIPKDFPKRVIAAAQVYADQHVRFDGYFGGEDDGRHYMAASDGLDNAYYGDENRKTYRLVRNKKIDDLTERVWVCPAYPVHALTLAGFPLRYAMAADFEEHRNEYLAGGNFSSNTPTDYMFFFRLLNVQRYFRDQQWYCEDRITQAQYRDKKFRPEAPFEVGDIVFMGHYRDNDTLGPWIPKHSGIVASVDSRGMPVKLYDMRVSVKMIDDYDGIIDQTRPIGDQKVYFKRFSDRYSLVGHGRIVRAFVPEFLRAPTEEQTLAKIREYEEREFHYKP